MRIILTAHVIDFKMWVSGLFSGKNLITNEGHLHGIPKDQDIAI
jgi:hypothetical protein